MRLIIGAPRPVTTPAVPDGSAPAQPRSYWKVALLVLGVPALLLLAAVVALLAMVIAHAPASPAAPSSARPAVSAAADASAWRTYATVATPLLAESGASLELFSKQTASSDVAGMTASIHLQARDARQLAQLHAPDAALQTLIEDYARAMNDEDTHCPPAIAAHDFYANGCMGDIQRTTDLIDRMTAAFHAARS